jgi:hypothetical protein
MTVTGDLEVAEDLFLVHNNEGGEIQPVVPLTYRKGQLPKIPTPADFSIAPTPGDDTTPPNSLTSGKLNGIAANVVANVGYSASGQEENFQPSSIDHTFSVDGSDGKFSLKLSTTLEYENIKHEKGESMVVWTKVLKQFASEEGLPDQELVLLDTNFSDWVETNEGGKWVDISTDIRYAEQAEAIATAVMSTPNSGQTAGTVKATGGVLEAKLGPIGAKGRIILTYKCRNLYSYQEMGMSPASLSDRTLVPLSVHLPYTSLSSDGGRTKVSVNFSSSCPDIRVLDPNQNLPAYLRLKEDRVLSSTSVLLPFNISNGRFSATWPCLPHRPTCLFFWLSLANPADNVDNFSSLSVTNESIVEIRTPRNEDSNLMQVSLPGQNAATLVRATVKTEAAGPLPDTTCRVFNHVTISDASGSTGMRSSVGIGTVRDSFNEMAVVRLLKRLESVPALINKGVVRGQDIWTEQCFIFDSDVKQHFDLVFTISDLNNADLITALCAYVSTTNQEERNVVKNNVEAKGGPAFLEIMAKVAIYCDKLRAVKPGGLTSFKAPADRARSTYARLMDRVRQLAVESRDVLETTFVNFDTDGGNNSGECYSAMKNMVSSCHVVGGVVQGYGSWVDQDCATRCSGILKGPCLLNIQVPVLGSEGSNAVFRRDFSAWIKSLKCHPVKITANGGYVTWQARQGIRYENGIDVLAVLPDDTDAAVKFGPPDITRTEFTGSTIEGFQAGDTFTVYLLCRQGSLNNFYLDVNGARARTINTQEKTRGLFFGKCLAWNLICLQWNHQQTCITIEIAREK